ncbi:MAG: ArsR/SmtB family transcription factor [Oligoflexus sp.]
MRCSPEEVKSLDGSEEEILSGLCKALGHPARLKLLRILIREGECISGDLADQLPLAASTISEHLRILKDAGLIRGSIDGPRRCYCVHQPSLGRLKHLIQDL